MSIYYNYAPDGTQIVVLSYVDDFVYWYTSEALGKLFVYTIVNRLRVNFLGFSNCFMSISISQIKYHFISVEQDRYATAVVAKYLTTDTLKKSEKFYKTNFLSHIIFTKYDVSTSDEQV